MAKKKGAAPTPAVAALLAAGVPHTLHAYEHDSGPRSPDGPARGHHAFADEAAAALGLAPERLFKTLVVDAGDGPGHHELSVALVPASRQLDLRALARILSAKRLHLADPHVAARSAGYVVGGISPLGQRHALVTVIDESALAFETIFASAGRRGLQMELSPSDLAELTSARWGAIAA